MRAVCSGTRGRGCCSWSDITKPPEITAPTPLSTFRLTHSPTVSGGVWDHKQPMMADGLSADRCIQRRLAHAQADVRFEPLSVFSDEADQCNRRSTDLGSDPG